MNGDPYAGSWDSGDDPLAYLPEDLEPNDIAFGFHIEHAHEYEEVQGDG